LSAAREVLVLRLLALIEAVSNRDARENPSANLALYPAYSAGCELHPPREVSVRFQLINHRPAQACDLAHLLKSQQAGQSIVRCGLGIHRRTLAGSWGLRFRVLEHPGWGVHGAAHVSGRQTCCARGRGQTRGAVVRSATLRSRAIHSSTSDCRQPIARPWNLVFLGNRPIRLRLMSSHEGLRVSRATSWELNSL
jgi:hypothetical protein